MTDKKMDCRCPRQLSELPEDICLMGMRKALRMKQGRFNVEKLLEGECVWYAEDPQSCYCFFKYLQQNPKSHSLKEISELFNTSINNIKLREVEALNNLKKLFDKNKV